MTTYSKRGIPVSSVSPQYLHTNSTSHTWPFSAVAELIDNAYDPDVNAKQLWITKSVFKHQDCLIFLDNGNGMDYEKMYKMLSFGFSDKKQLKKHVPVGLYGNGFKSGSMRLGKDAIVFSKKADTMCVGLLSQTYLERTGAHIVQVPIVSFTYTGQTVSATPEHAESLRDILEHSLFNTEEELFSQFKVIESLAKLSGTCIIIWNLRRKSSGELEFDFLKDPKDIRILDDVYNTFRKSNKRQNQESMSVPESVYSLRAYCNILYLIPRMDIILQGHKVEAQSIITTLARPCTDTYKPECLKKAIKITIGYNTKSMENYGLMMYNKNRLIKAYVRVACQRKGNHTGQGVIGVVECNHLVPTHNKQDFDDTQEYRNTMKNLNIKLEQYWKTFTYSHQEFKPVDNTKTPTDAAQVTCPRFLPEVSDEEQPGYLKTHKGQKKRTLDQCQDKTEKKKSKQIDLDNNIPGTSTSTASLVMFNQDTSEKIVGIKNIKTQASSKHQQNFEDQLLTAKQEINQLQVKVNSLEDEKSALASCCESLKKGRLRLGELRQSVACLLLSFVPEVILKQLDNDCEAVDEILTQVINKISPTEAAST
ncbi:MORC family CW-type zinc finger protein 3-like isoform X1 [Tachysurus fulvidraco]|uniref:MORC family CW-type zinc finger protein 3-like isoform X1 n=1 Tax=Tachysurus fulvidraco TaxID=1234273 RepID=UPI001FEF8068|nr:MORC family CW-type zinc finger protein 3-like isoform X1 [Tachysurus fulvidraco]